MYMYVCVASRSSPARNSSNLKAGCRIGGGQFHQLPIMAIGVSP